MTSFTHDQPAASSSLTSRDGPVTGADTGCRQAGGQAVENNQQSTKMLPQTKRSLFLSVPRLCSSSFFDDSHTEGMHLTSVRAVLLISGCTQTAANSRLRSDDVFIHCTSMYRLRRRMLFPYIIPAVTRPSLCLKDRARVRFGTPGTTTHMYVTITC